MKEEIEKYLKFILQYTPAYHSDGFYSIDTNICYRFIVPKIIEERKNDPYNIDLRSYSFKYKDGVLYVNSWCEGYGGRRDWGHREEPFIILNDEGLKYLAKSLKDYCVKIMEHVEYEREQELIKQLKQEKLERLLKEELSKIN